MKLIPKRSKKAGLPPGTLVHIGEHKTSPIRISMFEYDEHHCHERQLASPDEVALPSGPTSVWIDVGGIHKPEIIEALGKRLALHPLLLEDVVNTEQRPKLDDYDTYIYVVLKMLYFDDRHERIHVEQISLVMGPQFLLSFQENGSDVFDPIRDRLRTGKGRIRQAGPDYLLYSLTDAIVDRYFAVLELLGERVELMQDAVLANPAPEILRGIHTLKRELLFLRRSVWPLREVLGHLDRSESSLIRAATRPFFRDVYDHVIQIIDAIETLRDMAGSMLDIYLSNISYRLNAVVKVLTVITTIFMPLTFIVGVYGMNFEHMPELHWRWGYPAVLIGAALIAAAMLVMFKKKRWL